MGRNTSRDSDLPASLLTQAVMDAPWGFAITDYRRNEIPVVFVNRAFESVCGLEIDEILGKGWRCLLGKNPENHTLAQLQEAVRQASHCTVVLQAFRKDGSCSHYELSVAPVLNQSQDASHLTWMCRDIPSQSEREQHLAATNEDEERYTNYLQITAEAIWRLDFKPPIQLDMPESQQVREIFENGVFGEVNDAGARIYGLNKGAEVIGCRLKKFMDPSNSENIKWVTEFVRNRFFIKNLISYEKDTNGKIHTCINNMAPGIQDNQVHSIWGASMDVSEHREALQALDQSQKELIEKTKALEEKNTALRELIASIELDKKDYKDRITANIERVLLPSLDRIQLKSNSADYIEQHRQALEDLTSSFGLRVADVKLKLTSREIEVCNLVKNGLSSKEIANMLKIAVHTVEKHRRTARSKLGLANKGINLRTYLKSIQ
jgi:PAS domain S-box-containing protein